MPTKAAAKKKNGGLSAEERAAMKDTLRERKKPGGEPEVLAKIKAMAPADRALAETLHRIVKATAPELTARTYYGMPAYAKGDAIVCFFQESGKFKTRYSTIGFTDKAKLDSGDMWPTSYALKSIEEPKIVALLKKALG